MGYIGLNNYRMISYMVEENEVEIPITFKTFLHENLLFSTRQIRDFKKYKTLLVNSHPMSLDAYLRAGDLITAEYIEPPHYILPESIDIDICYEDMDVICVNKKFDIVAHPTKGHPKSTLSNAIRYHGILNDEDYKPRLINRLDRDTTGIIIFGKNPHAQHYISKQMQKNEVVKKYIAIVEGELVSKKGIIDNYIDKSSDGIRREVVENSGKRCITHYEVVDESKGFSLVELTLETGRTHQIRVHLSNLGHSIVGDKLYGASEKTMEKYGVKRQFLHAYKTKFKPPRNNTIEITAEIPEDMKLFLNFTM